MSTRTRAAGALAALAIGAFGAAGPADAHHRGGREARGFGGDVPSRIATRITRATRELDRAEERLDDGDTAKAISQLTAVRRNLASALKSTERRITADSQPGPAAAAALVEAQHRVATTTADMFDGQTGDAVSALASTLKAALDGRDAVLAKAGTLADPSDYAFVGARVARDASNEADAFGEAVEDDELTDEAKTALTDAQTQVKATATAATALAGTAQGADSADYAFADGPRGDCPRGPDGGPAGADHPGAV